MRLILFACALLSSIFLSSCRTETPNGAIPNDYLAAASQAVGSYSGNMQGGSRGRLTISLRGNVVSASFSGRFLSCGGRLGTLRAVDGDGQRLTSAEFNLSGGNCAAGSVATFTFYGDSRTLQASVLASSEQRESCPTFSEIVSCQSAVQRSNSCDSLEGMARNDCLKDESDAYGRCSACSTQTFNSYINGVFQR